MAQKNVSKHKTIAKQINKRKARAVGRNFDLDYLDKEYEEEAEENENVEVDDVEGSPIEVLNEDSVEMIFESDIKWTSPVLDDVAVRKSKVCVCFVETSDGVRAVPLKWKGNADENMKIFAEIVKKVNDGNFSSFEDMSGKFKSSDFDNPMLFRKIVTNNYGMMEPYGKVIKLNFLTPSGRQRKAIDLKILKRHMQEIYDDGYTQKGEIAKILVNKYKYAKSIQRKSEFNQAYKDVKRL